MRFTLGLLCLAVLGSLPAAWAAPEDWPDSPKRTTLETPYGTLAIHASDYLYGAKLTFDGAPTTPPLQGILNIPYAYVVGSKQMALVSEDKGQADCPISYYWVVITQRGYKITPPFGSCSADIRLTTRGTQLRMETPNREHAEETDIWEFDGQKVRKRIARR